MTVPNLPLPTEPVDDQPPVSSPPIEPPWAWLLLRSGAWLSGAWRLVRADYSEAMADSWVWSDDTTGTQIRPDAVAGWSATPPSGRAATSTTTLIGATS